MKKTIVFLLVSFLVFTDRAESKGLTTPPLLVTVKRNYDVPATEKALIVLDWKELQKRLTSLKPSNIRVTDQHFGVTLVVQVNDNNADSKPDQVILTYTFSSTEPVFTFGIFADGTGSAMTTAEMTADKRFEINYLIPFVQVKDGKSIAEKLVESTIHTYPDPKSLSIISPGKWTYEYGFFLNGAYLLSQEKKNSGYFNYMKQWVDGFISNEEHLKPEAYHMDEYRLDDILAGRLCIWLYQQTGAKKYKNVADDFIVHLSKQPKTADGGYWHKEIYPHQMWLDGIYMGDIFSMQYGTAFNMPHWVDEATVQIKLMYQHAADPKTGLLFHGWDESKNKIWANQETGTSPELWTRAIGWYAMALIECLDYLPANHPERKNIESIFQKVCAGIKVFQDKETSLWYQIINKGELKDNWIETSGSAMFTYAFAKGFHKGLLDKSFGEASEKAYAALVKYYVYQDEKGDIHLDQAVKVGSLNFKNSKGDYPYYISCERRIDDYKGLAALLYASMELKK